MVWWSLLARLCTAQGAGPRWLRTASLYMPKVGTAAVQAPKTSGQLRIVTLAPEVINSPRLQSSGGLPIQKREKAEERRSSAQALSSAKLTLAHRLRLLPAVAGTTTQRPSLTSWKTLGSRLPAAFGGGAADTAGGGAALILYLSSHIG